MIDQAPTASMLHVLTYRPEFEPPWPMRSHLTPITLNRLERPQVGALITRLAQDNTLPEEVVEHIVTKTDGVPLYVEELTKMLLDSSLLREEEDGYVLTGPLASLAIPETLQDSLMARLDQMHTAKEIAQLGSVLGREFTYDMIQVISHQDEEALQAGLAQLAAAELLYQRGRPPRARYLFKHALIQDAAYESLLRSTRQRYHQQIAEHLVARLPELVDVQPERVAHHYTEANCPQQAIQYWCQAGQQASDRSANTEAISQLSQGLELLALLEETPERNEQELNFLTVLGPVWMAMKGQAAPEAEQTYARARTLCQQMGEAPQLFPVLHGLWRVYYVRAAHQAAQEIAEQQLQLAQRANDSDLLLEAHHAMGVNQFIMGSLTAARVHLEAGIALYDPQQHAWHATVYGLDPGALHLSYATIVLWLLGYPEQALCRGRDALTLVQGLSHLLSRARIYGFMAWLYQHRREAHLAEEQAESAIALSEAQGFALYREWGSILRGWSLSMQGRCEAGVPRMLESLTAWQDTGATLMLPYFRGLVAEGYGKSGQYDEGLAALASALDGVQQTRECWWAAELHRLKGVFLLAQGSTRQQAQGQLEQDAEESFRRALSIAQHQQAKSLELRAATSLARLWQSQSQNKCQDAYDLLEPVYGWFTEGFDTADLKDAITLLDELSRH